MMLYDILRHLNSKLPGKADFGEPSTNSVESLAQPPAKTPSPKLGVKGIVDVPEGNGWRLYRPAALGARVNSETT